MISTGLGFGIGRREADAIAKQVVEDHRKGKSAGFRRMLTAQKYAYHIDGEGDAQWADIIGGRQVKIPRRRKGALRHQDNILRPMVDYWIAYFTTQPFRVVTSHREGQKSMVQARINALVANKHLLDQHINERAAAAMYMAAFNGWGILHSVWRNDTLQTERDRGGHIPGGQGGAVVSPGFTDVFPGNPFDTIFAPSATRTSMPWYSYGRSIPTRLVKKAFPSVPGINDVEGSTQEPSTSWFQRMLRYWESLHEASGEAHGQAALTGSSNEDNIGLICREFMPGQIPEFPRGALIVVGLRGASGTGGPEGEDGGHGSPILLHIGPLPGGVFSGTKFYALPRGDDPHAKAYVADLDDDQVRLNQGITMYAEMMAQYAYPQLFVPQGTQLLQNQTIGDKIIEYIHMPGTPPPQYQFPGTGANFVAILAYLKDIRESAFRKGGWQASSRGEASGANEPAKRAQFLAAQDKMIFAPTAISFRASLNELLQKNHALRRENQTQPLLIDAIGDDLGYMSQEYIHREDMSPTTPNFQLVSGFGASSEQRLAELNELVGLRGGDGQPVLPVKRYWQLHPDLALRPNEPDADDARRRRAHAINLEITKVAEAFIKTAGQDPDPSELPRLAKVLSIQVYQRYPPTWSDGLALPLFVEALDTLVQDPTSLPLVRAMAEERQRYMLIWQQQAAEAAAPAETKGSEGAPASAGAPAA